MLKLDQAELTIAEHEPAKTGDVDGVYVTQAEIV